MTIVAITGHRPGGLGDPEWVKDALRYAFAAVGATKVIQGMAEGADLISAGVAWKMDIPFVAARPWTGHGANTPMYQWALRNAEHVEVLNPSKSFPGNAAFHIRNEWMVNHGDIVVAVWNGSYKGGTAAAVKYARKVGKRIFIIDPQRQKIVGYEDEKEEN